MTWRRFVHVLWSYICDREPDDIYIGRGWPPLIRPLPPPPLPPPPPWDYESEIAAYRSGTLAGPLVFEKPNGRGEKPS